VVILGKVGRNLGAGMSGGYAYVYKLQEYSVNKEALASDELRLLLPSAEQASELRALISRHHKETNSRIASLLLENFESELHNFRVVMPTDYASVREIIEDATLAGLDPDGSEVWGKILEATNG
jgi:glutamate synthase (NADPH/NADH) large chain